MNGTLLQFVELETEVLILQVLMVNGTPEQFIELKTEVWTAFGHFQEFTELETEVRMVNSTFQQFVEVETEVWIVNGMSSSLRNSNGGLDGEWHPPAVLGP